MFLTKFKFCIVSYFSPYLCRLFIISAEISLVTAPTTLSSPSNGMLNWQQTFFYTYYYYITTCI